MRWKGRILALAVAIVLLLGAAPVFATDGDDAALGQSGGLVSPAGIIDITPPVLTSISVDKTVVEAPGTVTVTAEAWDDISGASYISVRFDNEQTGKYLYVGLNDEIWNQNSSSWENTGNFTGEVEITEHELPGTFELASVDVIDNAGNIQSYVKNVSEWQAEDGCLELQFSLKFTVNNPGLYDVTPPSIESITLDKPIVETGGLLEITATASDDISGASYISVRFDNASTGKYIYSGLNDEVWNEATHRWEHTGTFKSEIEISKYELPGLFKLESVDVIDFAGNIQSYVNSPSDWQLEDGCLPLTIDLSFTVVNDGPLDTTPPVLQGISLSKNVVEAPGSIVVTGEAADDLSGVSYISIRFDCPENDKYLYVGLNDEVYNSQKNQWENTGVFKGVLDISVYQLPGVYELASVDVLDYAGNVQSYVQSPSEWQIEDGYLSLPFKLSFKVLNNDNFDLTTNTNNPNLADEIAALPDGSTVGIDYGSNPHIGADVFEAIQGKDIDVVLIGNGVEWVFNGLDIDNPKDLDLSVGIEPIDYYWNDNSDALRDALSDTPAVVLSFPNNGQLPGEVKMRVKADSEFRQYLGVDDLYVYYFNPYENELQLVEPGVNVSNDGFIEFTIDHNSEFVITSGAVRGNSGGGTTPPINPTYPSGGSSRSSRSSSSGSSKTYNFDKRDVAANTKVNGNEIEVTGQTQLGFYQATYMGTKIEGVTTKATDNGVVIILPQEFVDSLQSKQWKKGRVEFFNAYVDVDYSTVKKVDA